MIDESQLRQAITKHARGRCDSEYEEGCAGRPCSCNRITHDMLVQEVKGDWAHYVEFPSNPEIEAMIETMVGEKILRPGVGCTFWCEDELTEVDGCETPCKHYDWGGEPEPKPASPLDALRSPWMPEGERLRIDWRGYSPRASRDSLEAFYEDRETLPSWDEGKRCWAVELPEPAVEYLAAEYPWAVWEQTADGFEGTGRDGTPCEGQVWALKLDPATELWMVTTPGGFTCSWVSWDAELPQ